MSFSSSGAMGAVTALQPSVADRMTQAICDMRKTGRCIRYELLAAQFSRDEISAHLRDAIYRAHRRIRGRWPGFPPQIAVDEAIVAVLSATTPQAARG